MAMRTIETIVEVDEARQLVVQLPPDVPVGKHKLVAILDESVEVGQANRPAWKFPVLEGTSWPAGLTFRREDLYAG